MLIFIKDLNCTLRLFMSMTQFYLASCRDRGGKDCWLRVFLLELQTVWALSVIVKTDAVLKRIFFLNESESRILFVIQKFFESKSESYSS